MKFFIAVLLISVATATIALNISPSDQIAAAKTFFNQLMPKLQYATRQLLSDENEVAVADEFVEGAASEIEESPGYVSEAQSETPGLGDSYEAPVETINVTAAAEFLPFSGQAHEVNTTPVTPAQVPLSESPQAQPLARDEVSEVIKRLGRVSRAVAQSSDGGIR